MKCNHSTNGLWQALFPSGTLESSLKVLMVVWELCCFSWQGHHLAQRAPQEHSATPLVCAFCTPVFPRRQALAAKLGFPDQSSQHHAVHGPSLSTDENLDSVNRTKLPGSVPGTTLTSLRAAIQKESVCPKEFRYLFIMPVRVQLWIVRSIES